MPGLYAHIPFCLQKCRYCDFTSYSRMEELFSGYCRALINEAQMLSEECDWGQFTTVFVGGGTPSLLPSDLIAELMEAFLNCFHISSDAEITLECNPGTLDSEKLGAYLSAGVNRLSIGVQSMDDSLLEKMGRIHSAAQAAEAFIMAKEAGFTNINADVMHGLPHQTELDYLCTLSDVIAFNPAHISAYQLILEEGTPLFRDVRSGALKLPSEEETDTMQEVGIALLSTHGYDRYEISSFAKQDRVCSHNENYWENGSYLGLGAGAHSAWNVALDGAPTNWTRWSNTNSVDGYIISSETPFNERNLCVIPPDEEAFECVMLGLRMIKGLSLSAFYRRFGRSFEETYFKSIEKLTKKGWLIIENDRARLTEKGLNMQNTALLEFMS